MVRFMGVRIGTGLSTAADPRAGGEEAARAALEGLDGFACDAAVIFAGGHHLEAPEATLEAVHDVLAPDTLVGCGAGGVLGGGREIEHGTAVSVWAASFGGRGAASPFHAVVEAGEETVLAGLPDLEGATGAILLADPFTFPADPILRVVSRDSPGLPLLGGIASARLPDGSPALFIDEEVVGGGAVGLRFDGVDVVPCVSQGAAPIGPELTITGSEGNVIVSLAGRPAYEKLRATVDALTEDEQELIRGSGGLLIGVVIDPNKPDYVQGDFLVRPIIGADRHNGAVAVGALVRTGQVVRLHVRDAGSADRDLREGLERRAAELPGGAAGALVFSCNGRGRDMFGIADHDARAVADVLAGAPAAGFFAAGEIGPVGGECFMHGFTATVALFGR